MYYIALNMRLIYPTKKHKPAAVDTAFLACHYGSVPAFQLDIFVVLEVHMLGQDKDCFAVSESRDYSLFHKAEAFSLPLDPLDFPAGKQKTFECNEVHLKCIHFCIFSY